MGAPTSGVAPTYLFGGRHEYIVQADHYIRRHRWEWIKHLRKRSSRFSSRTANEFKPENERQTSQIADCQAFRLLLLYFPGGSFDIWSNALSKAAERSIGRSARPGNSACFSQPFG